MYEAVRQRAPNSTKFMGVATTAFTTSVFAYVLIAGFGAGILPRPEVAATFTLIEEIKPPPPPPRKPFDMGQDELTVEKPLWMDIKVEVDRDDPDVITLPPPPAHPPPAGTGSGETLAATPAPGPKRIAPKLISDDLPTYPAIEQRQQHEGTTTLSVCVDLRGRVSSASVAATSGYPRLDEASVKWVKAARFSPGTLNGAAQAMCGHTVVYEWNLADARK